MSLDRMASSFSFSKMHGLGNDFVFIDNRNEGFDIHSILVKGLADRRRGVGCDQVIVLDKPKNSEAYVAMRIFNADGSEVEACGNATRCLGALLFRETTQRSHIIESPRGVLKTHVHEDGEVEVNMGAPMVAWDEIPLTSPVDTLFLPIKVMDCDLPSAVGMGNPHLIFFVPNIDAIKLRRKGRELERHPLFPRGTNIEFVQVIDRTHVRMRVWERGTGITQSCASGASAVVVAGVLRGLLDSQVTVQLDGGSLNVFYDNEVKIKGQVSFVYSGKLDHTYLL